LCGGRDREQGRNREQLRHLVYHNANGSGATTAGAITDDWSEHGEAGIL
jgi:hypothetical protein